MRKLLVSLAILGGLLGGTVATADPTHGLCTAYFNGSQTGQEHKRKANAFVEFANYVGDNDGVDNDGDDQTDEGDEVATPTEIWDFCGGVAGSPDNPKGVGGNPDDPNTPGNDGNGKNGRGKG